jgi:protein-S-isoprenylcysteine O-methyltransferase Ste14
MVRGAVRLAVMTLVAALVLFGCAGTTAWPAAWLYLLEVTGIIGIYARIASRMPDLVAERTKPPADAKSWDKPLAAVVALIGPFGMLMLAGLDHRYGWSGTASWWAVGAGLLIVPIGGTISNLAIAANRFFSALVRIQRDRGHRVIDTGPYAVIRHPGYLGSILYMFGAALALGSWWTLLFVTAVCAVLAFRTLLEDRTLQAELDGYADYARRVRYRLVPGVW